MRPAERLDALERALARISQTQHLLEKKKTHLRSEALRLRVSLSRDDAAEYATLTKERVGC